MATTIALHDETARNAAQAALWRLLSRVIEDNSVHEKTLGDHAWDCSDRILEGRVAASSLETFDDRLRRIVAVREAMSLLVSSPLGDRVEVEAPARELARAARGIAQGIAEDDGFWDQATEQRARQLAMYDALHQLADALDPAEVAAC